MMMKVGRQEGNPDQHAVTMRIDKDTTRTTAGVDRDRFISALGGGT